MKKLKWETIKLTEWNSYKLEGDTAFAKAKKLYTNRYPSNNTIKRLKQMGIKQIVYQNGDFITL